MKHLVLRYAIKKDMIYVNTWETHSSKILLKQFFIYLENVWQFVYKDLTLVFFK